MNNLRIIFYSFTIWVVAAFVNAFFSGILLIFSKGSIGSSPGVFLLALVFSLLFSAPGIFIFWLVFIFSTDSENLFGLLLRTGTICATASGILFVILLKDEFKDTAYYIAIFGVIAAITSIMIHHRPIVAINNKQATY